MKCTLDVGVLLVSVAAAVAVASHEWSSLYVDEAPQFVRPYVLPKERGLSVRVGQQIYRFSVTGNASAGAFTLLQTNAPESTELGVLPHTHKLHHENFYCTKGRFQLWAKTDGGIEQSRILTQGDYGTVPPNTTHSYQILDPDTQMTGVIQPGGFEKLFLAIGDGPYDSITGSEYIPAATSNASAGAGASSSTISALTAFDVYAQLDFSPRRDLVNGMAGSGNWHNGSNALAPDGNTPNFVAKNYGPKYLNTDSGFYHVIAPLATGTQTTTNFTMGTITMSPKLWNDTLAATIAKQHLALQMQEGELVVAIRGETARLIQGDVIFVPAAMPFTYYASVPFTKFLYVSAGGDGFDADLLAKSISWGFPTYPAHAGYVAAAAKI
ncbi:hypothetical protein PybrP1_000818 [[Pythium] brassicae (nom. inval.)]|nr:hypothetical protein PybrP1_000818 [[Pythium] brassicae (nom. inval.)]